MRGWRRPSIERSRAETSIAAQATYVSQIASQLGSGEWSADFGSVAGINAALGHNGTLPGEPTYPGSGRQAFVALNGTAPGSPYTILDWTGKSHFDGSNWWYCAGTTGNWPGSITVVRYSLGENKFRHWQGSASDSASIFGASYGNSHNFEGACYDPTRRKIFRNLQQTSGLGWWDVDSKSGGAWTFPAFSVYLGMEAFQSLGELWVFTSEDPGGAGKIFRYSMDSGEQVFPTYTNSSKPDQAEHSALCYLGGKIFFTGADNTSFHSVDSGGNRAAHADSPTRFLSYGSNGSVKDEHTVLTALNGKIYAFKLSPLASGRGVYCFDPAANGGVGSWSGNLSATFPPIFGQRWTVGALTSEGVVLLVGQPVNEYDGACHVWKP